MTKKEITSGNALIAKFMCYECNSVFDFRIKGKWYGIGGMKFHTSMDWLLPVIEKIENIPDRNTKTQTRYRVEIYRNTCEILTDAGSASKGFSYHHVTAAYSKTEAVFYAVKLFIEFYNKAYAPKTLPPSKPAPKFYAGMDEPYKSFHKMLEKYEKKMGWKGIFYAILKYQRTVHKDDGYNFGNSGN